MIEKLERSVSPVPIELKLTSNLVRGKTQSLVNREVSS